MSKLRLTRPPVLKDVARRANVGLMTVSRALRGIEGVSESKRTEIMRIAKQLNYVPNSNARSLVVANSDLVGISMPTLYNDVFASMLAGMRHTFQHAGFATVIDTTNYDLGVERDWVERVLSWRPAAMVLTGVDHATELRNALRQNDIPTLEIWDIDQDPIDMCVGIDHTNAGYLAGRFARNLGYLNPAFVGVPKGSDTRADKRLSGLRRAFDAPVEAVRRETENSYLCGYECTLDLIERANRPDVVFYLNDHLAFGGLMACQTAGIRCPEDIGVVGFNALDLTRVLPLKLTTVSTPRRLIGVTGARNLLARLNGLQPHRVVSLPVSLIAGDTTCAQNRGS